MDGIIPKARSKQINICLWFIGFQIALAYIVYQLVSIHGLPYLQAIDKLKKLKVNTSWRRDDPLLKSSYDPKKKRLTLHSPSFLLKYPH